MITQKSLIANIEELQSLQELVTTYEFIAASAMRRIRTSVLENRAFHLGLSAIFQEVKRAYEREVSQFLKTKHRRTKKHFLFMKRNRKSAIVLLSANASLYGDVIQRSFLRFLEELEKGGSDVVLVGRLGRTLFQEAMPLKKYTYFDFPDTTIALENLKTISGYLNQYEIVKVFHGKFKSIVFQEVGISLISGEALEASPQKEGGEVTRYIFEPSLETIVIFFETEIFSSLLEQVFHESRLAKFASRMLLLDRASVNVGNELKKTALKRQQFRHRALNRKQLDSLGGIRFLFS